MSELLIGIGGLVLSVLTYFAGVQRTKYLYAKDNSENRINRVVNHYVTASQSHKNNDLNGLIQAGINNLKNDAEIREACERIVNHAERHPCSQIRAQYEELDLFEFFNEAKKRGYDFLLKGKASKFALELISKNS